MISILLISIFFLIFIFLFSAPLKKNSLKNSKANNLTIIVPCRNEEDKISFCIDALDNQNYPKENLEILIIDDQSNDQSYKIIEEKIKNKSQFKLFSLKEDYSTILTAKARVIDFAIKMAKNEIIVICDADCMPQKLWFQSINQLFNQNYDVIAGVTVIDITESTIFKQLQNLDWIFLLSAGAVSANASLPISCIGSNLAFKKKLYYDIGGFENLDFSLTEDLILYKTFTSNNKNRYIFPVSNEMLNITFSQNKISDYLEQRKRWFWGSFDLNIQGKLFLGMSAIVHIFFTLHAIFTNYFIFIFIIYLLDTLLILRYCFAIKQIKSTLYIPIYLLFFTFNCFFMPIFAFLKPEVIWKNRKFNHKGTL